VNNSGIETAALRVDCELADFRRVMAVNADGCFLGTKWAMRPGGMAGAGGTVINLSSVAGLVGVVGLGAYCAAKGAVQLLTKSAALESARLGYGVRVNSIHPAQRPAPFCSNLGRGTRELLNPTQRVLMQKRAVIVGWSHTPFGKLDLPDVESLIASVARPALDHAGVAPQDVDFVAVGVFNNGLTPQGFEGGLVSLGEPGLRFTPAVHVENACATGTAALHTALDYIESGRGRIALVIGAEKMTSLPAQQLPNVLLSGCYHKEESNPLGFAGIFGQIAEAYFQRHGDHREELAMIAAKNHANAVHNPYAHVRKAFDVEFCNTVSERNPLVAGPLRRTDCSMVSDGAAALVIADEETAATLNRAIRFRARTQVNDFLPLSRRDPIAFEGARTAWEKARAEAGVSLDDLDFVETHDCFTIAEMIEYEAMGLARPGEGWRVIRDGLTQRNGKLPVNVSGGLKAKGHPLGATGVSMHVMAAMQLMGEAGDMQVSKADIAGVFNMGGAAVSNYVSILERMK
jgi:acetyl-CoA C-acetyltransferase